MRNLIQQLRHNIYEARTQRDKLVKEINQEKKISANLNKMREIA